MRKKILSILLAVVMLASVCSMMSVSIGASTTSENFYQDDNEVWHIVNEAGIEEFRSKFSNGNFVADKVVLDNDIAMTKALTDVASFGYGFIGEFDGQGHTISNLKITNPQKYNGLLGAPYLSDNSTKVAVKNLALKNASMTKTGNVTKQNTGFIYGYVNGTVEVENLYIQGTMTVTGSYEEGTTINTAGMGALIGGINGNTTVNLKNSVFNISTSQSTLNIRRSGAIIGAVWGNNSTVNVENCVACGDFSKFGNTYYLFGWGYNSNTYAVNFGSTLSGFVIDAYLGSYGQKTGLVNATDIFDDGVTTQDVSDFDASTIDGFTKTAGHLMPTTLLKMFPQHCLEENAVDGGILKLQGYQTKGNDIRLVATIADKALENYKALGFEVVVAYGGDVASQDVEKHEVYSSICANSETGDDEISADELIGGDGYIFALHFHPTHTPDAVTFQIRTYYVDANDNRTYGSTEVFTVTEFPGGTVVGGQLS